MVDHGDRSASCSSAPSACPLGAPAATSRRRYAPRPAWWRHGSSVGDEAPQADDDGGHVDEGEIDPSESLVADEYTAERPKPGERSLHMPTLAIPGQLRLATSL